MTEWRSSLRPLLEPESIAVVGASESPTGRRVIEMLRAFDYPGQIAAVNPRRDTVLGLDCFPSIEDVPFAVDCALIQISADRVESALLSCASKGVKSAVINSAGFAEVGAAGLARQERLRQICDTHELLACGPSSQGIISVQSRFAAYFTVLDEVRDRRLPTGGTVILSQSGALLMSTLRRAVDRGLGFRWIASTGGEAVLNLSHYVQHAARDAEVDVIAIVAEAIREPAAFAAAVVEAREAGKRIVALKLGVSSAGRASALAHTGSLAGNAAAGDAFLRQLGVARAATVNDLVETMVALGAAPAPRGRRIGVVSPSGGSTTLISDVASRVGFELPALPDAVRQSLASMLPDDVAPKNPLDIGAVNPDLALVTLRHFGTSGLFDAVILAVPCATARITELIGHVQDGYREEIPLYAAAMVAEHRERYASPHVDHPVTVLQDVEAALRAIAAAVLPDPSGWRMTVGGRRTSSTEIVDQIHAAATGVQVIGEFATKKILGAYGLPGVREALVASAEEAVVAAREIGFPVALKLLVRDLAHKSDLGGVALDLQDESSVLRAHEQLLDVVENQALGARLEGVLVQEYVVGVVEVILGVHHDVEIGPIVMLGLGGVLAESLNDVVVRVPPIDRALALEMIGSLRGKRLIYGGRGRPIADVPALVDCIVAMSELALDAGAVIQDVDLNPLVVLRAGQGVRMVDALIVPRTPAMGPEAREPNTAPSGGSSIEHAD